MPYKQPSFSKAQDQVAAYLEKVRKADKYLPWLDVRNARLMSRRSLIYGVKDGQVHTLLSDGEARLFFYLEPLLHIASFNCQFGLTDLELAWECSVAANVPYPRDKKGNAVVMSTDQIHCCVNFENDTKYVVANTFKYSKDLLAAKTSTRRRKRILQKLEIERIYWDKKGIEYKLWTDLNTPRVRADNNAILRNSYTQLGLFHSNLDLVVRSLVEVYSHKPHLPLGTLVQFLASSLQLDAEEIRLAVEYAIWCNLIPYDHTVPFCYLNKLPLLLGGAK